MWSGSFAHVCDTGGAARRSWLRGLGRRDQTLPLGGRCAQPGWIMRLLFGIGKPRVLQARAALVWLVQFIVMASWRTISTVASRSTVGDRGWSVSATH